MPAIVSLIVLFALLLCGSAWAEDKRPIASAMAAALADSGPYGASAADETLRISRNRMGIVFAAANDEDVVAKLYADNKLTAVERLTAGVTIAKLPEDLSPSDILAIALKLGQNHKLVRNAGLVATLPGTSRPAIILDQVIVQAQPGASPTAINKFLEDNGLVVVSSSANGGTSPPPLDQQQGSPAKAAANLFLLRAKDSDSVLDPFAVSAAMNQRTDLFAFAHPNMVLPMGLRVSQPADLSRDQWHHQNIGQDNGTYGADARTVEAWKLAKSLPGDPIIAVIEFGFDAGHADLTNQSGSFDFVTNGDFPAPDDSVEVRHGTAMAGLAAGFEPDAKGSAKTTQRLYGACPGCRLMLLRVSPDIWTIEQAIAYASANGAAVITNSWGFQQGVTMPPSLVTAIHAAAGKSVVLFAMDNAYVPDCGGHPTGLSSVIAVSRSTNRDLSDHAGYGDCLSLLAPSAWTDTVPSRGTRWIATADTTGAKGYNASGAAPAFCPELSDVDHTRCVIGTSASTALAAGVAGLVLAADPTLPPGDVKQLLQDTADKIEPWAAAYRVDNGRSEPGGEGSSTHGFGRINAFEALSVVAPVASAGHGGVDIFLRDSALDWGNTSSSTASGAPPNPRGKVQSVDIKLAASPSDPQPTLDSFDALPDTTTPSKTGPTRVFVRIHNRGPNPAGGVSVKLYATLFDRSLPVIPANWNTPKGGAIDQDWRSVPCAGGGDACSADVGYSGASVAGTSGDGSAIITFDLPSVPDFDGQHHRLSLLATVDASGTNADASVYSDPVPPLPTDTAAEALAPASNNVAYRNVPEDTIEERGACSALPGKSWVTSDAPQDVRWAIADVLGSYAWALDDKRADDFVALFASTGTYKVCDGGGDSRAFDASTDEMKAMLEEQFANLAKVQTRHILSNTLLNTQSDASGKLTSVESRTTMLVTMQHNDTDHPLPDPDYTAEVRATFVLEDGHWKFQSLTIYSDSPQLVLRGR